MTLLATWLYFVLLTALGMPLAKRCVAQGCERLLLGLLFGSFIAGVYVFSLAQLFLINAYMLAALPLLGSIALVWQWRALVNSLRECAAFINDFILQHDRWRWYFIVAILLLLVWIFALAYTPPRAADAMRYHLAQLSDIVRHQGFIPRPYVHYNFPLYFGLSFLPVFYAFKGIAIKLAVCSYFSLSLVAIAKLAQQVECQRPRLLLLLLFLTPLAYHEAHIALNDWVIIFYMLLGLLCILASIQQQKLHLLYIAFIALGFAFGIKYQVLIFLPWFLVLSWSLLRKYTLQQSLLHIFALCVVLGLTASPFLLRNYYYLGNPIWPVMNALFHVPHNYLYEVAQEFTTNARGGMHNLSTVLQNIRNFISYPLLPVTLWTLIFLGAVFTKPTRLRIGLGLVLYFLLWWLVQPVLFLRFGIYILPVGLIAAVNLYDRLLEMRIKWLGFAYRAFIVVNIVLFIGVAGYYSNFYFQYLWKHDLGFYHQYTWYYPAFQWINQHVPPNARVLVINHAGQTYYLNRDYMRADPEYTATIDWPKMRAFSQWQAFLRKNNISYVFYVRDGWSRNLAERNMQAIMQQTKVSANFKLVYQGHEKIYTSRIKNVYRMERIVVYKVNI